MANIKFQPTRDWIVLPTQRKSKTDSGIELVGGAERSLKTNILKVVAVGPTCAMVKKGDTVMVHPNSEGLVIHLDEGEFVMVNEFQICGVFPKG